MLEILLLMCVVYAGARGVESLAGTTNRQYKDKDAEKTVVSLTKGGPKETKKPGPTDPGGTFSASAPLSSALGGKAAVPLAVLTETGSTMWKAVGEGYRERWPEIREERRQKMAERAARRKAEKEAAAADKRAKDAVAKAGPPPLIPPKPTEAPTVGVEDVPAPPVAADKARKDSEVAATRPTERPHLTVVPTPKNGSDMASSPHTLIPEIRTLDGLLNALILLRAMCEMRGEEAEAVAADDLALSNRLDQIEAELADLEVDDATRAEIAELRESIHTQSKAAAQYGAAAKDAADFAGAVAQSAHKNHSGIAEAVQSSPIELAAQAGYYNH